jgi:hypothetical protein
LVRRVSRVSCRIVDNALMQGNTGIDRVLLYLSNKDLMQAVICPRRKKKLGVDQWSGRQLHVIGTRLCHILQLIYHFFVYLDIYFIGKDCS